MMFRYSFLLNCQSVFRFPSSFPIHFCIFWHFDNILFFVRLKSVCPLFLFLFFLCYFGILCLGNSRFALFLRNYSSCLSSFPYSTFYFSFGDFQALTIFNCVGSSLFLFNAIFVSFFRLWQFMSKFNIIEKIAKF